MATARQELDIVIRTRAEGLEVLSELKTRLQDVRREVGKKTSTFLDGLDAKIQGLGTSLRGLSKAMRFFGLTAIAVLGGAALRGFINQQEELSRSLGRTRFFLSGFAGGMEQGIIVANRFADSAQKAGLANSNLAREIGAKSLVAIKDQTKALRVARAALLGHKLGIFDANSALQAMATSNDNNTEALRGFLRGLGIAAPEFASYETLIENFIRRNEDAQASLTDFGRAFTRLKGLFAERAAEIGGILGEILAPSIEVLADIFEDPRKGFARLFNEMKGGLLELEDMFGVFGTIVGAAVRFSLLPFRLMVAVLSEIFFQIGQLPNTLAGVGRAIGSFGSLIGRGIKEAVDFIIKVWNAGWKKVGEFFKIIASGISTVASALWEFMKAGFRLAWNFIKTDTLAIWKSISSFLTSLWGGILGALVSVWESLRTASETAWNNISGVIASAVDAIIGTIDRILGPIQRAIDLINNFISAAQQAASTTVAGIGTSIRGTLNRIPGVNLAEGGIVRSPIRALIGEAGPEAVIPLDRMRRMGMGATINITLTGNTFMGDEDAAVRVGDMIVRRLELVHRFGLTT